MQKVINKTQQSIAIPRFGDRQWFNDGVLPARGCFRSTCLGRCPPPWVAPHLPDSPHLPGSPLLPGFLPTSLVPLCEPSCSQQAGLGAPGPISCSHVWEPERVKSPVGPQVTAAQMSGPLPSWGSTTPQAFESMHPALRMQTASLVTLVIILLAAFY